MCSSNWTKCQISEHKWILFLLLNRKHAKNRMKGLELTWAAGLRLLKQFLQEKSKMCVEGIVDESQAYHKYRFLKKSTWVPSYLWVVGCQSLSDSWFNSCPFCKYDLQIGILVRSQAPVGLSVSKKEKGASLSDMALLHSCNGLWVAWVCLPCRGIRTGRTRRPFFNCLSVHWLHDIKCYTDCQWVFSALPVLHLCFPPSLLFRPSLSFLFFTFLVSSYHVLTLFFLSLIFFHETLLMSKTFCHSTRLHLTSFWNFYIFPWKSLIGFWKTC